MAFFSFDKKMQVLLIAGALAGAPGCYESGGGHGDVGGDDGRPDVTDPVADDVGTEDPIIMDDPPPWPMCTTVQAGTIGLETTGDVSSTHALFNLNLTMSAPTYNLTCSGGDPCVTATVGGTGRIGSITQPSPSQVQIRYENDAMAQGDEDRIDIEWAVTCRDGGTRDEVVRATFYACKTFFNNNIGIYEYPDSCNVVDPPPRAMLDHGGIMKASPAGEGKVRLTVSGVPRTSEPVRWEASSGSLEVLSDDEALFTPSKEGAVQVVQAAIVTPHGVLVEVYKHKT
jgi:hypothetical protein